MNDRQLSDNIAEAIWHIHDAIANGQITEPQYQQMQYYALTIIAAELRLARQQREPGLTEAVRLLTRALLCDYTEGAMTSGAFQKCRRTRDHEGDHDLQKLQVSSVSYGISGFIPQGEVVADATNPNPSDPPTTMDPP